MTIFDKLRSMSGGKLKQSQVSALDKLLLIAKDDVYNILDYKDDNVKTIGSSGLNLIKEFESLRLKAYDDGIGVWTIGYGTIKYPNGVRVKKGDVITEAQANQYLLNDVSWCVSTVNNKVKVPLTQNQFDALCSLIYNIGETNFNNSTLLKRLNAFKYDEAAKQFLVWNKAGGKTLNGLIRRREAEKKLFERK